MASRTLGGEGIELSPSPGPERRAMDALFGDCGWERRGYELPILSALTIVQSRLKILLTERIEVLRQSRYQRV